MEQSKIEKLICDNNFSYSHPYFYNNPFALRCELGIGDDLEYISNANKRANEIYDILCPFGADAIIFNYWVCDYSECGSAEEDEIDNNISYSIEWETKQLKFLLENQNKYRHHTVRNLETYDDSDDESEGKQSRNRIICYRDEKEFDHKKFINNSITNVGFDLSFVSFQNECILSIYDDRGCDIVFATHEKMKEFYPKLRPYFLSYDIEEMEKRFNE